MIYEAVGENRPEGLMQFTHCPECGFKLIPLAKINEDGNLSGIKAKICNNKLCWRFTADYYLMTWKRKS